MGTEKSDAVPFLLGFLHARPEHTVLAMSSSMSWRGVTPAAEAEPLLLEVQRVLAETNVVVAMETQKNYGIQAEGFAYQKRELAQAEATALDTVTTTEMEQYSLMRTRLNMTNKEFFTYLWMRAVDHNKLSRKVLEVPVPSAIREGTAHA